MNKPNNTVWDLDPHTLGKHLVLRNYLDAWLPIISRWNQRILFIDGFAGPGEYSKGEQGSPLIAINSLQDHRKLGQVSSEVNFFFIENDSKRVTHLRTLVEQVKPKVTGKFTFHVEEGRFDETLSNALDAIEEQNKQLAPSFVMIDPFGVSDTPMDVIGKILSNEKSEVYVSFMYEHINRFKKSPQFEKHLSQLFGCDDWQDGVDIENKEERKNFFFNLYKQQLRRSGATQVVHFELYGGNRLVYAIFFATKHTKGSDVMKKAIWKVAPFGDFKFRGTHSTQLLIGVDVPDFEPLKHALQGRYRGKDWIKIDDIIEFVMSDQTDYHSGQVKKNVLIPMEDNDEIVIDEGSRKRKKTFPNGTLLQFR